MIAMAVEVLLIANSTDVSFHVSGLHKIGKSLLHPSCSNRIETALKYIKANGEGSWTFDN